MRTPLLFAFVPNPHVIPYSSPKSIKLPEDGCSGRSWRSGDKGSCFEFHLFTRLIKAISSASIRVG
jgi:hypothetical protein